ncbi:MAG: primosomal protein N' [Parvularculaceae bacterium]
MTQAPGNSDPIPDARSGVGAGGKRVKVLFPLPLAKAYDYLAPAGGADAIRPGAWVIAPFAGREAIGVVWPGEPDGDIDESKLKSVRSLLPAEPLAPAVLDMAAWVAGYTMFPAGSVLRLVMRSGEALTPPKGQTGYRLTSAAPARATDARARVLDYLASNGAPQSARVIAEACGVSDGVVRGLVKAGALVAETIDPDPPFDEPDPFLSGASLSPEQAAAAETISRQIDSGGTILIDGVTGSGKTEVYLEAAAEALRRDPKAQILIMLPEIALTLPFLKRVHERFGAEPAAWHSELTQAARRRVWRRVNEGQARIVVGARSALFLPYRNLRLVIVDEEHESAYKQEDGVIYHARDMAVAYGARHNFPVVLASATPSLETVVNVDQGRYGLARLASRFGPASMPKVELVDLRHDAPEQNAWLSPPLVDAVDSRLSSGEQSLLFINRRGYAPLTICRKCGHRMKSPHSDTWLVEHRFENRLVCHHTGFSMPKPSACPACNAVGALAACGPGVERVAEEAAKRWPNARRAVLSSDMMNSAGSIRAVLDAMEAGDIDILVATQIVAKGHHFPNLTLVGVVDADMSLAGGDLRAAERTYQLLSQVAGRAGRASLPGEALLQTYRPEADVLRALQSGDRDAFLAAEAAGREEMGFPPFGRLAAIKLSSEDEQALKEVAAAHRERLIAADGVSVFGPAPAPIYRLRGRARMRFLVKTRREINIQAFVKAWLARIRTPARVRRVVDIDPYSFL